MANPFPVSPNDDESIPSVYAELADADVVAGVTTTILRAGKIAPARRLIIGVVGAAGVTLTRPDGTDVVVSQAQCNAMGKSIYRQFIAVKSANSTDLSVEY